MFCNMNFLERVIGSMNFFISILLIPILYLLFCLLFITPPNDTPDSSLISFFQVVKSFIESLLRWSCPHALANIFIRSTDALKNLVNLAEDSSIFNFFLSSGFWVAGGDRMMKLNTMEGRLLSRQSNLINQYLKYKKSKGKEI